MGRKRRSRMRAQAGMATRLPPHDADRVRAVTLGRERVPEPGRLAYRPLAAGMESPGQLARMRAGGSVSLTALA